MFNRGEPLWVHAIIINQFNFHMKTKTSTKEEYLKRINTVVEYINNHIIWRLSRLALVDRGYKGRKKILGIEINIPGSGKCHY